MSDLHRRILNRLLAAWTAISLVVGGVALFLGMQKVDAQLVALATAESGKISAASLPLLGASNRSALDRLAADFVREHFIVVELYDRERQRLTRAANPAHAELAGQLARQAAYLSAFMPAKAEALWTALGGPGARRRAWCSTSAGTRPAVSTSLHCAATRRAIPPCWHASPTSRP